MTTPVELVLDGLIVGRTKRLVLVTRRSPTPPNYLGSWDLGIAVTKLCGLQSYTALRTDQE